MEENTPTKEYTGSVYIAVVGGELEYGVCTDSINRLIIRGGDTAAQFVRGTKGYETRSYHMQEWRKTHHPFILFLDHDMVYDENTLEALRSHKLPYVTGYYMRRVFAPIYPVYFEYEDPIEWPMKPKVDRPDPEVRLFPVNASGWGCILMHRDVIDAVDPILKSEEPIIEDDMDIWPYDLERVMHGVNGLAALVESNPDARTFRAAAKEYSQMLSEEIRPLRCDNDPVGSDIRFPFYARAAGFTLICDSMVQAQHIVNYPISPADYHITPDGELANLQKAVDIKVKSGRKGIRKKQRKVERAGL